MHKSLAAVSSHLTTDLLGLEDRYFSLFKSVLYLAKEKFPRVPEFFSLTLLFEINLIG